MVFEGLVLVLVGSGFFVRGYRMLLGIGLNVVVFECGRIRVWERPYHELHGRGVLLCYLGTVWLCLFFFRVGLVVGIVVFVNLVWRGYVVEVVE